MLPAIENPAVPAAVAVTDAADSSSANPSRSTSGAFCTGTGGCVAERVGAPRAWDWDCARDWDCTAGTVSELERRGPDSYSPASYSSYPRRAVSSRNPLLPPAPPLLPPL